MRRHRHSAPEGARRSGPRRPPSPRRTSDPGRIPSLLRLQRTAGNRAVGQVLRQAPPATAEATGEPADEPTVDSAFVGRFVSAVSSAYATWKATARITGAIIQGASALGGSLVGVPLGPLIRGAGPGSTTEERVTTAQLAGALDSAFRGAMGTFSLPGLAMYPAFASWPGPMAPPMPCIPQPLPVALPGLGRIGSVTSPVAGDMAPTARAAMTAARGTLLANVAGTRIVNAMGTGPVPTFAPPFVPAGPVISGRILPTPGVLQ